MSFSLPAPVSRRFAGMADRLLRDTRLVRFVPVARTATRAGVLAGCDGETTVPRGAAYPEPVGYDSPDQAPAAQQQAAQAATPIPAGTPVGPVDDGEVDLNGANAAYAGGAPSDGPAEEYADTDPSALTDFRSALEPYGTWTDDATYGSVWVPASDVVGPDFTPYVSDGHWAYGDDYVWVSDYAWGWAPFHYGRWTYLPQRSAWGWIPGRTYAGAWVSWRSGYDGYVGWAAMPPTWGWRGGQAVGIGAVPPAAYTFCATNNLFAPGLVGHTVQGPMVAQIAAHTSPYVAAHPGIQTLAHPTVSGPPPIAALHIAPSAITRLPEGDRGLLRAQQFAHPSSAQLAGAHAPSGTFTASGRRYAGHYGNYSRSFAGGAVAGHALIRPSAGQFGTTRIGAGPSGSRGFSYSYGGGGARGYGGGYGGRASYGGGSFHGGSSFGGAVPQGSHGYYGTPGAYTVPNGGGGGGGHYGGGGFRGGGGGGGHGGGGHR
jgi:hypothetical protein